MVEGLRAWRWWYFGATAYDFGRQDVELVDFEFELRHGFFDLGVDQELLGLCVVADGNVHGAAVVVLVVCC